MQASPRLAEVTTSSLDALRKYTAARQEFSRDGDFSRVMQLGYEAIQLDSTFAQAYGLLAVSLNNRGGREAEASRLVSRAYELRSRLSVRDQHAIEAAYFRFGPRAVRDSAKSIAATIATVADPSDHGRGLHNHGVNFFWSGKLVQAESVFHLALARDTSVVNPIHALVWVAMVQGKGAEADRLLTIYRRRFPGSARGVIFAASLTDRRGAVDSARVMLRGALSHSNDPFARGDLAGALASIEGEGGAVRAFDAATAVSADARSARGVTTARMDAVLSRASYYALVVGDRARAQRLLDSATAEKSIEGMDPVERPYAAATIAYTLAGNAPAARRLLAGVERQIPANDLRDAYLLHVARAHVAISERRWEDAIREARLARTGGCLDCGQLPLALAYDGRGDRDSAIAAFERTRVNLLPDEKQAPVLRRLGELYEAKGDVRSAIDRFQKFVTLWQRADPELQPQLAEIKKRIASLQAREARSR